jgi:hypothetical protein
MRRRSRLRRRLFWTSVLLGLLLLVLAATLASALAAVPRLVGRLPGRLAGLFEQGGTAMQKRIPRVLVALVALVVGIAVGSVSLASAAPSASAPRTLTFVAVETGKEVFVDVGAKGDSPGDSSSFGEKLYAGGKLIGRSEIVCVSYGPAKTRCNGTLRLPAGTIEAGGSIRFGRTFSVPILGGTGSYMGAGGVARITELNEKRSRYVVRLTS